MEKLWFSSDYMEGMHEKILERLVSTNRVPMPGYGTDAYCEEAREKIREACGCPEAAVYFLVGGTQTNATVIDACLRSYQGVIAPVTGHVSQHEAGAIEHSGHKVLALEQENGKLTVEGLRDYCKAFYADENHAHMVEPGMVYLSQPTESGSLYCLQELEGIREVCDAYHLSLYVDGARLAYALACPKNDVGLSDLARLCDVFYIGGTKCGAGIGEAVVIREPQALPHFFTIMKQHGALLAKGRFLGLAFGTLFTGGLYEEIGREAIRLADALREGFQRKGYPLAYDSPTNQVFVSLTPEQHERLSRQVAFSFWETTPEGNTIVRLATSWATREEDVLALLEIL